MKKFEMDQDKRMEKFAAGDSEFLLKDHAARSEKHVEFIKEVILQKSDPLETAPLLSPCLKIAKKM